MKKVRFLPIFAFIVLAILGWGVAKAAPILLDTSAKLAVVSAAVDADDLPPQRSTVFDRGSFIPYTADLRFNRNAAMTIEAWVYPEKNYDDPEGCQSFVEYQSGTSYWFGTCPNLRFHRSNGNYVKSSVPLKIYLWSHVAVSNF